MYIKQSTWQYDLGQRRAPTERPVNLSAPSFGDRHQNGERTQVYYSHLAQPFGLELLPHLLHQVSQPAQGSDKTEKQEPN